jgi:hypothetical protein
LARLARGAPRGRGVHCFGYEHRRLCEHATHSRATGRLVAEGLSNKAIAARFFVGRVSGSSALGSSALARCRRKQRWLCKLDGDVLREMLRHSSRSPETRCKQASSRSEERLDRTQEVAGSSPASSTYEIASPLRKVIGEALSIQVRFRFSRKATAARLERGIVALHGKQQSILSRPGRGPHPARRRH